MSQTQPNNLTDKEVRPLVGFFASLNPKHSQTLLWAIAEVIGVLIGLKPTTMISFDLTLSQVAALRRVLSSLRLQSLFEEIPLPNLPSDQKAYMIFLSQSLPLAEELRATRNASLTLGWCPDNPTDQHLTLKIGQLLGYPQTAIEYYAFGPRDERGIIQHRPDAKHDRYYIHSPDHFRTEYEQFEDILHPALVKLSPTTATQLRTNPKYYWTSADLPSSSHLAQTPIR